MKKLKLKPIQFLIFLGVFHLFCASLSFAASSLATRASSEPRKNAKFEMQWRTGVGAKSAQDARTSSKGTAFGLDSEIKYHMAPEAFLSFNPQLRFESGSYQSVDGKLKDASGLYVGEAAAYWEFMRQSSLAGGALDQATNHSSLLISQRPFPGVRAILQAFEVNGVELKINAEQAVPTSASLSTNTTGLESTPSFASMSMEMNYKPSRSYFWKNRIGAFSYDKLPSAVNYESSLRGNTILPLSENEYESVYKYQGMEVTSDLRLRMMRGWDLYTVGNYIHNNRAPEKLNKAYSLGLGSEFFFVGQKSLDLVGTAFRIEPDATVAYFASSRYSYTNRVGYAFETYLNFKKYNFRLGAVFTDAELIYVNTIQSREKTLTILLETFYASI